MDVPLARFLARFSVEDEVFDEPVIGEVEPPPPIQDPTEAIVAAALADATVRHAEEISTLQVEHAAALEVLLANARQKWCASEGEKLAARLEALVGDLRDLLSEKIGHALAPLVGHAVVLRTQKALLEGVAAILSDPNHPALSIRAPGDLLDALRTAYAGIGGIHYVAHDDIDATVVADGLRVETRLHAVLPMLAELEL